MITKVIEAVYIGDAQDASEATRLARRDIDHVVTLAEPRLDTTTDYHPLRDGTNKQAEFDAAVDTVRHYIETGESVIVHCRMGRSRAPTVVGTAFAAIRDERFSDGLETIHNTGRFVAPHRALMEHARTYLEEPTYNECTEGDQ